ncbi:MAG TPA: ATP-binding protein [Polyangiaceae bacterium]
MSTYVMVVDDDEALRDSVCELLEQDGFRTVRAESGAAALRRLRSDPEKPDLILLDLMMPDMNGWQFREEQLRDESLAAVPVVVMTAQRNPAGIQVNEVVHKPVKLKKLLEVIRRHATPPRSAEGAAHSEESAAAGSFAPETSSAERALFFGGGELGARMAEIDWSSTALGPVSAWPQSLRTCVRIILTSRQPMFVWWGESLINLYNDAYKSIIGGKHPCALAQPASVVWREIWDEVGPRAETAMRANEGTYDEALLLIMERHGYAEETYYTFSYSPVPNDLGGTGGIICANTDDTDRIIGARQLALLRELAGTTVDARSVEAVCLRSVRALATNERDVPFALLYVMAPDRRSLQLEATVRLDRGHPAAPERLLLGDASVWPCVEVLRDFEIRMLRDLASRFGPLPGGAWNKPPTTAAIVPIAASGETGRAGVLVVGLNPFRLFDESYRSFLELAAGQISASIANAHAYEEERRRAEALAEIDRAKTAFFSNVSHEFRTPLTLLLGPAHDLLAGIYGQLPADQRGQLEVLHRNGLRLQKLVNALLDFSRLEAGRVRARYAETDLPNLTRELASTFQSAIERAGLTLVGDCPPLGGGVFGERDMWEKIVLNLLSNALKFTFQGRIEVALRGEGEHVALSVSDTGVGIPADELPRVFERFHRIEGTRARTHEGSGIGLALVQELARLHGGSVRVDSAPNAGTTFTVRLPKGRAHLPEERVNARGSEPPATLGAAPFVEEALRWLPGSVETSPNTATPLAMASARERRASVAPGSRNGRILLADDNADMRDYVRRHLERYWYVEAVADGAQALAAARARPPDLVLTDIMMPELDGFALLRELRRHDETRDIPVILLSARSGEEANVEGLSAGAEDYLTKPFSARELVARVRTRLELSRLRNEMRAQGQHLFTLFDHAPAPIAVLRGQELVFEMANALYLKVCGRVNVVGKRLLDVMPELRGQGFDELLLNVMRNNQAFVGEEMRLLLDRRGDGVLDETYWTFTYAPLPNVGDDEQRVMALCHDVTEQVLARHQVEESEDRFRRIVTQVQAGIAQVDLAGRFTLVNDRYREIVGRSDAELRQLRMQDITHPDDLPRNVEAFQRLLEQGAPFVIEKRYVKPDGSIVWVQNSVSRIDGREGRAPSIVSVTVDVTQRKFAEQALEDMEREREARVVEMERAVRFSEMFAGILGHDLRNPLGAILAGAGLIEMLTADEKIARPARRIVTSAARMERMIAQLLDFTRIRLGRGLPLERAPVDLSEVCRSIIDELESVQNRQIDLQQHGDLHGTWDRDRLSQLVSNLAANACQHGAAGERVSLELDGTDADVVRVRVRNRGLIRDRLMPVIFEPLRHSSDPGERREGSSGLGLGLYITQQIALSHGGTIHVDSSEDRGTCFTVELPRHATRESSPRVALAEQLFPAARDSG